MSETYSPARPGAAERLAGMIRVPTVAGAPEAFERFAALLAAEYPLLHERLRLERVGDTGLLFRWSGNSTSRPVVLMAHYDVVPALPGPGWTHDPFSGVIADGSVWGRGALDDKGPMLVILEAVENLVADGFAPAHDVYLSFGGNEESYGSDAIATAALLQERGIMPWLVIDEGGAVVDAPLPFVPVPSAMVGVGEKGIATVRLTASSAGGHASAPPVESTSGHLARALLRLDRNPFRVGMPRPVRTMLASFEPHVGLRHRLLLRALRVAHPIGARVLARRGGEAAALMRTTVAVTMLQGGTAANVLPPSVSAILNIRIATDESIASVLSTLRRRIADDAVSIELVEGSEPSALSATDNEQFRLIRLAVDATYPGTVTAPYVMMAATDSRHLHRFAPAVYRFSPLEMDAAQRAAIHGENERVAIASLSSGERFFQFLLRHLD